MWDATVSVASSSNFGPDWDDVDIDPSQPAYASYFHPKKLRRRQGLVRTFGKARKTDDPKPNDDGYNIAESSEMWKNRDINDKRLPRPRIVQHFGKVHTEPSALDYDTMPAIKKTLFRKPEAIMFGKWKEKTTFTEEVTPGPGAYSLPSQLNLARVLPEPNKKKKMKASEPTLKQLRAEMYSEPGPGKYRPDLTKKSGIPVRPRPVMRPRDRRGKGRMVLDLRTLDVLSNNEEYEMLLGIGVGVNISVDGVEEKQEKQEEKEEKKKKEEEEGEAQRAKEESAMQEDAVVLRRAQTSPGPGEYVDIMTMPRAYDGFKHTSTHDILGLRRSYIVGGKNEVNRVGPGEYEQGSDFGAFDFRLKWSSQDVRDKMKRSTAIAGTVPWPSLVSKAELTKVKSRQLVENYTSEYGFPHKASERILRMGSKRFNSVVPQTEQHFDFAKSTMKLK